MKPKPYASKPWWPRVMAENPTPTSPAAKPDPMAVFRHQVAIAARRLGLPVSVQDYLLLSLNGFDVATLRPDIVRQAREWVAHRKKLPRALYRRRSPSPPRSGRFLLHFGEQRYLILERKVGIFEGEVSNQLPQSAPGYRFRPKPAILEREALVLHLMEVQQFRFKQVAAQLGLTRERARQGYARAYLRRREHFCPKPPAPTTTLA